MQIVKPYRKLTQAFAVLSFHVLIASAAHAQTSFPNCASASSDPDGDGWGWENNQSCKVVATTTTPNCSSASSDPDGDGWGWENNQSCKVVATTTTPNCSSASSDPDGDGWGWENNQSCKVVTSSGTNCTTATSDPDGDGWGWENNASCVVPVRTAMQITGDMGVGWNLGNSLDSFGGETNWGNPKTTKAMIDTVKNAGFKTLRVPVTWDDNLSGSSYTIKSSYLDRVEEVVNYGLSDGMYVIINIHHNNGWVSPTYNNESNARDHITKIWQQIAARFNKYGDKVIFETLNEPRSGDDWWGVSENFEVLNRLNNAALSTIRATGGNNAKRLVMIPGYVAGANDQQLNGIVLPNDSKYAISTHAYFPFGFALDSTGTSSFGDTSEIDNVFSRLNTKFISKGIPVVMGEWASTNKNNLSDRVRHAEYYVKKAKAVKIPTVWWDNNNQVAGSGDAMGLLNRSNNTWYFPTIVTAIMNGNK